jgi:hypothetical protein
MSQHQNKLLERRDWQKLKKMRHDLIHGTQVTMLSSQRKLKPQQLLLMINDYE